MTSSKQKKGAKKGLSTVHRHAAGIDIGANEHYVAVPTDHDPEPVRSFGTFTGDLLRLAGLGHF